MIVVCQLAAILWWREFFMSTDKLQSQIMSCMFPKIEIQLYRKSGRKNKNTTGLSASRVPSLRGGDNQVVSRIASKDHSY